MKSHIFAIVSSLVFLFSTSAANAWQLSRNVTDDPNRANGTAVESESDAALNVSLAPQLAELYINQWVHVSKNRTISGSVVGLVGKDTISLAKVRVSMMRDGRVEYTDDTDIDGDFLIENCMPGVYTMVAETADSMSIFSLTVLDEIKGQHLPNKVEIRLMPTSARASEIVRGQTLPKDKSHVTPDADPLKDVRKTNDTHQVMIDSAGNLKGQLSRATERVDMSTMTVYVMKDGVEVNRTRATSDGKFVIRGLSAGCYGLLAAGEAGLAATGFCATTQELANQPPAKEKFVSFEAPAAKPVSSLNIELGDPITVQGTETEDAVASDEKGSHPPMMPMGAYAGMGYGSYGGGGGGGGFGGRFGGLGSLAGIGGLIAAGVILATDDENVPVASPIAP